MPDTATTTQSTDHLLTVYLRDHFAGAAAGLALAQRCQHANDGTPLGAILADIAAEIEADRDSLRDIMKSLAVSEDWLKDVLGQASEFVGRLKSNGMLAHYSPSRVASSNWRVSSPASTPSAIFGGRCALRQRPARRSTPRRWTS